MIEKKWVRASAVLAFGCLSVVLWAVFRNGMRLGPYQGEILFARDGVRANRAFMRWLAVNKPSGATFTTCSIGTAGFDGEFTRVVDMLAIIDPVAAHRPADNFGHGKPGHEKFATLDEILAQKPTYIQFGHVHANMWDFGYYLDARMRLELARTVEGVWRRDELADTGTYLPDAIRHFEAAELRDWTASGTAFEHVPTLVRPSKADPGIGEWGAHINSFDQDFGDLPRGRLLSPPFELAGDLMVLRVGGGFDPEHLYVALLIDGERVFSETGLDSENLSRRTWPIGPYRGKKARLEIVDESSGRTGHIIVDEVVEWRRKGT